MFKTIEIKNNVYKHSEDKIENTDFTNDPLVVELRKNTNIKERKLADNISSFNFKRVVFNKGLWDAQTIKARGLFINTATTEVVARSYNKTFDTFSEGVSIEEMADKFVYPVTASIKYNGFLGLVGYNSQSDQLVIATKSITDGVYVEYFKNIFYSLFDAAKVAYIKDYVRDHNVTLVFEVIDPVNDPHIIKYEKAGLVLLDSVKRTIAYEKEPYDYVQNISLFLGIPCRDTQASIHDSKQLLDWYKEVTDLSYKYQGEPIEGFMLEDASGYMLKVKLPFYTKWKAARGLVERMKNGKATQGHHFFEYPEAYEFYIWLKGMPQHYLFKNIIDLRECYEEHKDIEKEQKESVY